MKTQGHNPIDRRKPQSTLPLLPRSTGGILHQASSKILTDGKQQIRRQTVKWPE